MTIIEQIKAEIERRITDNTFGAKLELIDILAWLDTLESEKSMNQEGLDVTDFCKPIDPGIAQCIADHSWEMLGEDEKPVPNDLEEAAKKYAHCPFTDDDGNFHEDAIDGTAYHDFVAGAKWQKEQDEKEQADLFTIVALDAAQRAKEQMMSEAVEGLFWNTPFPTICLDDCKDYNFKDNQRVRIIIVKD